MENEAEKKFTWVIKNFTSLQFEDDISSDIFVIGGCKWFLMAYPEETQAKHLSLSLVVADFQTLPFGWKRHTKFRLTVVNQLSDKLSQVKVGPEWFDEKTLSWGCPDMLLPTELHERDSGFLVNGELTIIAEIDVLEVIGKLDETETTQSLKKRKQDNDGVLSSGLPNKTQLLKEVNGFLVLPSQTESVKRIFEKHPNMALNFQAKNQRLRTSCMNTLLDLIDTLCQSLQDLSMDDLGTADSALTYLKSLGFKVDWLECKLEEVKEKKIAEEIGEIRIQELEEELKDIKALLKKKKEEIKDLKKKCSNTEALLKKEKAKVLAARVPPLTLDDVV